MARKRVLVVDDEASLARAFARILEVAGYETQTADDGLAASRLLERKRFDAMVIDLFMPVRDGLETIREAHRLYPGMGIVVASGGLGTTELELWLNVSKAIGAAGALKKPVSSSALLAAVAVAVSGSPASTEAASAATGGPSNR